MILIHDLEGILKEAITIERALDNATVRGEVQVLGQQARNLVQEISENFTEEELKPYLFNKGDVMPSSAEGIYSGVASSALYAILVRQGKDDTNVIVNAVNGGWGARVSSKKENVFFYNGLKFAEILEGALPRAIIINSGYGIVCRKKSVTDSNFNIGAGEYGMFDSGSAENSKFTTNSGKNAYFGRGVEPKFDKEPQGAIFDRAPKQTKLF